MCRLNLLRKSRFSDFCGISKLNLIPNTHCYRTEDKERFRNDICKVCAISFERPVNYLCDAWHVFPPKYEAWTHFNN